MYYKLARFVPLTRSVYEHEKDRNEERRKMK